MNNIKNIVTTLAKHATDQENFTGTNNLLADYLVNDSRKINEENFYLEFVCFQYSLIIIWVNLMIDEEKKEILDNLDIEIYNSLKKIIVIDSDVFHNLCAKRLSQYKDINLVLLNKKFAVLNPPDCGNTIANNFFGVTNSYVSTICLITFVMEADRLKKIIKNFIETNKLFLKEETQEDAGVNKNNVGLYHHCLKEIGWELFSYLKQYIKINDSLFSFWNILRWPKFYYQKVSSLIFILENINSVEERLLKFSKEHNTDDASREYITCFFEYLLVFKKAINLLKEWARMMGDSRSPNTNAYTRAEISAISDQYNKAQKEYVRIGWQLKLLFEKL